MYSGVFLIDDGLETETGTVFADFRNDRQKRKNKKMRRSSCYVNAQVFHLRGDLYKKNTDSAGMRIIIMQLACMLKVNDIHLIVTCKHSSDGSKTGFSQLKSIPKVYNSCPKSYEIQPY